MSVLVCIKQVSAARGIIAAPARFARSRGKKFKKERKKERRKEGKKERNQERKK